MGFSEMLVLGVIALLVIGPKQLPEVARVIGRTLNEFKRATGDLTSTFYNAKREADSYINKTTNYMHQQRDDFEKSLAEAIEPEHFEDGHNEDYSDHGDFDHPEEEVATLENKKSEKSES